MQGERAQRPSRAQPRVGVLGLGAMGSRIARRLLAQRYCVVVWNRSARATAPLVAAGAQAAASPAAAAATADVLVTMVADPAALVAVTEGAEGMLEALRPGHVVVEMSTVGPRAVERLAAALPAGTALVDAPVLGSVAEAERGSLVLFVGGSDADVRRVEPLLGELGTPLHVGPVGAGAAAKLVANSTLFASVAALGEALALADGFGLHRETAFRILAETPLGAQAERRREALTTMSFPPRFALRLAHKDARLVVDEASAGGTDVRIAAAVSSWFADAERAGAGTDDYTAVLAFILGQSHHLDV